MSMVDIFLCDGVSGMRACLEFRDRLERRQGVVLPLFVPDDLVGVVDARAAAELWRTRRDDELVAMYVAAWRGVLTDRYGGESEFTDDQFVDGTVADELVRRYCR